MLERLWQCKSGQRLTAEQVMTCDPICVLPTATLPELVEIFHDRHFRHLLVTDKEGNLRGVISDRDVLRMMGPGTAYKEVLEGILAGEIMSTDLVTIEAGYHGDRSHRLDDRPRHQLPTGGRTGSIVGYSDQYGFARIAANAVADATDNGHGTTVDRHPAIAAQPRQPDRPAAATVPSRPHRPMGDVCAGFWGPKRCVVAGKLLILPSPHRPIRGGKSVSSHAIPGIHGPMAKDTFRIVTRGTDGQLHMRDYNRQESLLRVHTQIGVDDCSTDLGLRTARACAA